jgi:hypothetical protein
VNFKSFVAGPHQASQAHQVPFVVFRRNRDAMPLYLMLFHADFICGSCAISASDRLCSYVIK